MSEENNKIDYKEFYENYVSDLKSQHVLNQKRISVGIRINIFLPLLFLIISFLINSSKLVFLILWIVSLFGIAFYLMYVEYTDFKMQGRLSELGEGDFNPLIGEKIEAVTNDVSDRADKIDEHVENTKKKIGFRVEHTKKKIAKGAKQVVKKKDEAVEKIKSLGGNDNEHN